MYSSSSQPSRNTKICSDGSVISASQQCPIIPPPDQNPITKTCTDGSEIPIHQQCKNGCLIATATYGSELAPQVQQLREIRDEKLLKTEAGSAFMGGFNSVYYSFTPTVAKWEQENPSFKNLVKTAITPMISSLSILNHVDMDSEAEVLGYGISLVLLNIGMYFGIPAIIVIGVRRKFLTKLD